VTLQVAARLRSEAGAELVEFALVLPLLLLVLGGIVDFGMLLQRQQVVTNAAREGARLAAVGYSETDVQSRVTTFVQQGVNDGSAAPATTVVCALMDGEPCWGKQVTVRLAERFFVLGPFVFIAGGAGGDFGNITLSAVSTMRVEPVARVP
jgi:Flp pilus assembly protein TadG